MIDNAEETELDRCLATVARLSHELSDSDASLKRAESERDDLQTEVTGYERDLRRSNNRIEDLEVELADAQSEIDSVHEGIGLRSIIERSWAANPIATENDLQSAGLGQIVSTLRTDHQSGFLNFSAQS